LWTPRLPFAPSHAPGPPRHPRALPFEELRHHGCRTPEPPDLVDKEQGREQQRDHRPVTAATDTAASSSERTASATVTPPTIALMQATMLAAVSSICSGPVDTTPMRSSFAIP